MNRPASANHTLVSVAGLVGFIASLFGANAFGLNGTQAATTAMLATFAPMMILDIYCVGCTSASRQA